MSRDVPAITSQESPHRADGRYFNPWPGGTPHGLRDFLKWTLGERQGTRSRASRGPALPLPVVQPSFPSPRAAAGELVVTWVGHSTFLVQIGGVNVLLDPQWSERASPLSFLGPRRLMAPAVQFESLPPLDVVIQSHDHYDHLDRATVRQIVRAHPGAEWLAPRDVGAWLRRRGARVGAELDWWQRAEACGLEITCTPAQHFGGRRPNNRDATLWCGWTIRWGDRAVYFAGDTALHPEFGAIARALGPFDAALLPIGAYEPRWFMGPVHMDPAQAVEAYGEIASENGGRRCLFVAMHWGTFRLTDEPVDEPPALARASWRSAGLPEELLWIPRHGETRRIAGAHDADERVTDARAAGD